MKALKVLHMISSRGIYGAENVVLSWMNQLPGTNPSILVFASKNQIGSPLAEQAAAQGFSSTAIHADRFGFASTGRKVMDFFRATQPDLIHSHGYKGLFYGKILCWRTGTPLIHTNHGFVSTSHKARFNTGIELFLCRFSPPDLILTVADNIRDKFISAGIDLKILRKIDNAVMPDLANHPSTPPPDLQKRMNGHQVISYIGRLSHEKGPDLLLKAVPMVVDRFPDVLIIVAGDGPMFNELQKGIQQSDLNEHVLLTGFRKDVHKIMTGSQIVVLPSRTEGTPLTMLEAMIHSKPVVGFAVGGIQQTIEHGKTGLLAARENPEALARALHYLLEYPDRAERIGAAARDLILEKYNLVKRMDTMTDMYREVCARPKLAP